MKIAILSDIHSNIFALDNVLFDLRSKGIEKILVAGDLIGYYYWPNQVISKLMEDPNIICISGNHEDILKKTLDNDEDAKIYKKKYGSGFEICKRELSISQLNWLLSLPKTLTLTFEEVSFFLSHGSLTTSDDYIYPDSKGTLLDDNYSEETFTIFGNTHYPFIRMHKNKYLINPGSVGQPRDVSSLSSYVVINTENMSIQFNRVAFESSLIADRIKQIDPDNPYLIEVLSR